MLKSIVFFFFISLACFASSPISLTEDEKLWIAKQDEIKYVYDPSWRPFEWANDNQEHTGIIHEILQIIKTKTQLNLVPIYTKSWDQAVSKVKNSEVPMFSVIGVTKERKNYLNFSEKPIFSTPYVLVSRHGEHYLDGFKDTKNKKVATIENSTIENILNTQRKNVVFSVVQNVHIGFSKLQDRSIDVFVVNETTARYYLDKLGYDDLNIAYKTSLSLDLRIAIRKDFNPQVISIINKALETIEKKDMDTILQKWVNARVEKEIDWALILKIGVVVFLVLIILLWNTRRLNALVREKTLILHKQNDELENLVKRLEKLSITDALTDIYNRRYFIEIFPKIINSAKRDNSFVCLMMIDIDYFKSYNDLYGHLAGDQALTEVALVINSSLNRADDYCFRLGGKEFAVLFKTNDEELSNKFANKLREDIHGLEIKHEGNIASEYLSVSIGISCKPAKNILSVDSMYKEADDLLYQAKNTGRNKVVFLKKQA